MLWLYCLAAARVPGEQRRVNAPSLAMFAISPASASQSPAASVAAAGIGRGTPVVAAAPVVAANVAPSAGVGRGAASLRAPPGFETKVVVPAAVADNIAKPKTARVTVAAQMITTFGMAKGWLVLVRLFIRHLYGVQCTLHCHLILGWV